MLSDVNVSSTKRNTMNVRGLARARSAALSPARSCVIGSSPDRWVAGSVGARAGCGVSAAGLLAPPDDAGEDTLRKLLVPGSCITAGRDQDTRAATLRTTQLSCHIEVTGRAFESSLIGLMLDLFHTNVQGRKRRACP